MNVTTKSFRRFCFRRISEEFLKDFVGRDTAKMISLTPDSCRQREYSLIWGSEVNVTSQLRSWNHLPERKTSRSDYLPFYIVKHVFLVYIFFSFGNSPDDVTVFYSVNALKFSSGHTWLQSKTQISLCQCGFFVVYLSLYLFFISYLFTGWGFRAM